MRRRTHTRAAAGLALAAIVLAATIPAGCARHPRVFVAAADHGDGLEVRAGFAFDLEATPRCYPERERERGS